MGSELEGAEQEGTVQEEEGLVQEGVEEEVPMSVCEASEGCWGRT